MTTPVFEDRPETARGRMLYQGLLTVHRMIRRDLDTVEQLAEAVLDELEETNPAITPVVERLKADHRAVSDYLDAVEAAARALSEGDSHDARQAVADALELLKGHLLTHLEYEELNVAATARRLRDLP